MNYLESSEYKDAKKQLVDDYAICFNKIETYIQLANVYGLHQEACLIQILDDFLSAQAEGKQLISITGPDLKKYCDTMIKAEKKRNKNKLELIAMLAGIPLIVMFLSFLTSFLRNDNKLDNLANSITISAFSVIYPVLFMFYYIVKWRTAKALFHHAKASRLITTIVSGIVLASIFMISDALNSTLNIAIRVPFPLFISITMLSLSILVVIVIIEKRDNKQFKLIPEPEEFTIEQVICPICEKEYDMDYPKCPYCKNK